MLKKEHQAIQKSGNVCFHCLKELSESDLIKIHIPVMGWGSGFDSWGTEIHLCSTCYNQTNHEWWKLEKIIGETDWEGTYYKYENEIFDFIKQLPLAGQELFWNRFASDYQMESQDWIDYELGILPHEKCQEYEINSPDGIKEYKEKFPICQHPVNKIYEDGSKSCWCPFGANGKYGQIIEERNISSECYQCEYFKKRTTPIKDILDKDFEDYKNFYIANINWGKYKIKFGDLNLI